MAYPNSHCPKRLMQKTIHRANFFDEFCIPLNIGAIKVVKSSIYCIICVMGETLQEKLMGQNVTVVGKVNEKSPVNVREYWN